MKVTCGAQDGKPKGGIMLVPGKVRSSVSAIGISAESEWPEGKGRRAKKEEEENEEDGSDSCNS